MGIIVIKEIKMRKIATTDPVVLREARTVTGLIIGGAGMRLTWGLGLEGFQLGLPNCALLLEKWLGDCLKPVCGVCVCPVVCVFLLDEKLVGNKPPQKAHLGE